MNDRKKIEQPVAEEFKRFNDEFADSLRSETHRLQSAIDQLLHASGKHVRRYWYFSQQKLVEK